MPKSLVYLKFLENSCTRVSNYRRGLVSGLENLDELDGVTITAAERLFYKGLMTDKRILEKVKAEMMSEVKEHVKQRRENLIKRMEEVERQKQEEEEKERELQTVEEEEYEERPVGGREEKQKKEKEREEDDAELRSEEEKREGGREEKKKKLKKKIEEDDVELRSEEERLEFENISERDGIRNQMSQILANRQKDIQDLKTQNKQKMKNLFQKIEKMSAMYGPQSSAFQGDEFEELD